MRVYSRSDISFVKISAVGLTASFGNRSNLIKYLSPLESMDTSRIQATSRHVLANNPETVPGSNKNQVKEVEVSNDSQFIGTS